MSKILNKLIGRFTGFVVAGEPVCPSCGSTQVIERGFDGYNRRHDCMECGCSIRIKPVMPGRELSRKSADPETRPYVQERPHFRPLIDE
nr:hypothetical protein [uncultured Methanoregula sp.]